MSYSEISKIFLKRGELFNSGGVFNKRHKVHFTLLYKALEGRCGGADFWKYDFQKSIFSPCGMNGYEHDLGREKTNLDVFYTILNFFLALNRYFKKSPQNAPNTIKY